jgi:hypothetical protein
MVQRQLMLTVEHFIRLGLSRLKHPLPAVKLKAIHSLAEALESETGAVVWKEYLAYLATCTLESEAAEALTVAFIGRKSSYVTTAALYRALAAPSPLSDVIIMGISGMQPMVNMWAQAHSGEVPQYYTVSADAIELTQPNMVPPIFKTRLRGLEMQSGLPFIRQWQYEIERLIARHGKPETGSFGYWTKGRETVAQVLPRTFHFGRSAYLRTLALAFELWDLPPELAYAEATYAIPGNFIYSQMLPGSCPTWAQSLQTSQPGAEPDCADLVSELLKNCASQEHSDVLLYLNAPLNNDRVYHADLRIAACYVNGSDVTPEDVFMTLDAMLNERVRLAQNTAEEIVVSPFRYSLQDLDEDAVLAPAIVPAPMESTGYLQSDLITRFPYLPISHATKLEVKATPVANGMVLEMDGRQMGCLEYWNQRWAKSRPKESRGQCAVAMAVHREALADLAPSSNFEFVHFWELAVLERDSEFSDWESRVMFGRIAI